MTPGADLSRTGGDGISNRLDASERPKLTLDGAALLRADAIWNDQRLGKCHRGQQEVVMLTSRGKLPCGALMAWVPGVDSSDEDACVNHAQSHSALSLSR